MLKLLLINIMLPLLPLMKFPMWFIMSTSLMLSTLFSLTFIFNPLLSLIFSSNLFILDGLSTPLISLTLWISSLMILASAAFLNNNTSPRTFLFFTTILNIILLFTFSMQHILFFYICFESSLIPTFLLILGWGYQAERLQASMYLLMYTITASLPLLINLSMIYSENMNLSMIFNHLSHPPISMGMLPMWWFMCMAAFLVKMPLFISHIWLPKAHVEAPVAGSMVLAGILLKLGSYGLIRMIMLFSTLNSHLNSIISSIALWGGCITSLICIRQSDIKSLIAYSSVGHMGLMTAGIMSSSPLGMCSALTLMVAHGLCSSGLFLMANLTYELSSSRSLILNKGILMIIPAYSFLWFMLCATNMAAPPSINLLSEVFLIASSMSNFFFSFPLLGVMSFLSAAYSLILYSSTNHGNSSSYYQYLMNLSTMQISSSLLHLMPLFLLIAAPNTVFSFM
uniref:NADH dehydrogenase subunit 4 n=1 Tax=Glyphohesione klatti TaxID=3053539 RepID=UPI0030E3016E